MKRLATGRCKREMEIVGEWSGWQGRLEKGEERGRGGMLVCFCGDGAGGGRKGVGGGVIVRGVVSAV